MNRRYLDRHGLVHDAADSGGSVHITTCERANTLIYSTHELIETNTPTTCFRCLGEPAKPQ